LSPSLDSADVSGGNSVAHYIESTQPDQVRITTEDRTQYLLYSPSVESDVIVSADGLSVPIADIINLEIMAINPAISGAKTAVAASLVVTLGFVALYALFPCDPC
jgi:hypothetical protein